MSKKIAIIGLGFGAEFIPIYQQHPDADLVAICQRSESKLQKVGDQFGIEMRYTSYEELLQNPQIEAVHINTPIPYHGEQSIKALKAGKHVACTVPMATTVKECEEIVHLCEEKNLKYIMMETVIYSREFLFIKDLYEKGELGRVQFLKASHQQDMDGWPNYWPGLPPMHYATHCVAPVLGLTKAEAEEVSCFGSGTIRKELIREYNSPFAVESCHIKFKDSDLSGHVYRSLFDTARQYRESFEVYGSEKSIEWPLVENEKLVVHTSKKPEPEIATRVECPDFAHLLPKEIQNFTTHGVYNNDGNEHLSFTQGAGHGGSHPHIVHQFINMLKTNEDSYPNVYESANITCVGILAHESALHGGEKIKLPGFTFRKI
ncbi:MAG: Gfo/Idh/MocA family oxidoreductase [bacterium]|nr:Gfo/Idh/MocA family oxidoreductase [bacterium]